MGAAPAPSSYEMRMNPKSPMLPLERGQIRRGPVLLQSTLPETNSQRTWK